MTFREMTKIKINVLSVFIKPFLAAAACGVAAYFSYIVLADKLGISPRFSTLVSVCVGGVFYAATLLLIKGIAKDDVEMLPKGEKIAKALAKFGLLG